MKRVLTILLAVVMMFAVSTFCNTTQFDPSQPELPIDSFNPLYVSDESVLYYASSEAKKLEDGTALKRAVADGKIVVIKDDAVTELHENRVGEFLGASVMSKTTTCPHSAKKTWTEALTSPPFTTNIGKMSLERISSM